jgi:hypothetical protein
VQSLDGRGGTDSCRTDCADFRLVGFRAELNFESPRLSPSVSANETTFGNHEWIVSKFDSEVFQNFVDTLYLQLTFEITFENYGGPRVILSN